MNIGDYDRMTKWRRTAQTWVAKASAELVSHVDEPDENVRRVVGYEAESLLAALLYESDALVRLLDPEDVETIERSAKALAASCRARRLAGKLGQVEGRTPDEASAFLAAAGRLRDA